MPDLHRIYGAEVSPYSVKVRSYFRYKGIPHEWLVRNASNAAEYQRHARLPLIPLVITPQDEGIQDSTPILERIEQRFPEPSIHPEDPIARFVSELLEEFGDEWGNKWMFHYRWAREVDQISAAERIVQGALPGLRDEAFQQAVSGIRERMIGRVWFVGSSPATAGQIERSFRESVELLEDHLRSRPYLFGGRPAFGDFGLWGQIYNAYTDPTPGEIVRAAPRVTGWVERMLDPKAEGPFEPWSALEPGLLPLLRREVGARFLPWSDANARAIAAAEDEFSVALGDELWTQRPQKYHARSLEALREKYRRAEARQLLDPVLENAGCQRWLR